MEHKKIHTILVSGRGNSKIVEGSLETLLKHFEGILKCETPHTFKALLKNLNNSETNSLLNEQSTVIYEEI